MKNKIAGIILAAGGSTRIGKPKQLLAWQGKELINHAIDLAVASGLDPIIVVLGAFYSRIMNKINDKDKIVVVRNLKWKDGQSTSIQLGLSTVRHLNIPTVLILVDQPNVTTTMIKGIIQLYKTKLPDAIMVETNGKRTPPTLLSTKCYTYIDRIEGDMGARDILKEVNVLPYNNTHDNAIADIDTMEDYYSLISHSH